MPTPADIVQYVYNKIVPVKAAPVKQAANIHIVPVQLNRIYQDAQSRRAAVAEAERAYFPFRYKMQQLFLNTTDNLHIKACMERRKDLTLLRDWYFGEKDKPNDDITLQFTRTWFNNFLSHSLDALFYGYTLIQLNDLVNGEFPKLKVVKRWNVSPDRYEVGTFPYMPHGINFIEDPEFKDWYVYVDTPNDVGVSPCGYGILWDISIAEIFLRNLLGFNGSFVELFAQPFRHGKTTKTNEDERAQFEQALINMGSSGYAITDTQDEIAFIETALGGTGYKSYDNLEARLQKLISKLILGHADAIDSTPGKLGSGNAEDNPVYKSMRDKQIKDGEFIENVVNDILLPQLRNLGFNIPDECKFCFKNDAEVMENANTVTDLAVKIKNAGLQMDEAYYFEQTGIKVSVPVAASPFKAAPFTKSIQNKLNAIYR